VELGFFLRLFVFTPADHSSLQQQTCFRSCGQSGEKAAGVAANAWKSFAISKSSVN